MLAPTEVSIQVADGSDTYKNQWTTVWQDKILPTFFLTASVPESTLYLLGGMFGYYCSYPCFADCFSELNSIIKIAMLFAVQVIILSFKNILYQPEHTAFDSVKGKGVRQLSASTSDTGVHSLVVHLWYIKMSSQKHIERTTVTRLLPNCFLKLPLNTRRKRQHAER